MARVQYTIVWNNYPADVHGLLQPVLTELCKYACYGLENAPTTGTPHVQGYVNLKKKLTITSLQNKLQERGITLGIKSFNDKKKTPAYWQNYCAKEGQYFWETGDINSAGQGKRTDLTEVSEKILRKRPIHEVAEEYPECYIRNHRGIKALAFETEYPPDERPMEVVLLFGDSGTGKSHKARMLAKLYGPYYTVGVPNCGSVWFDGYRGEKSIIIDEFKGWLTPTQLNTMCDKYKLPLNIKGATVYAKYEHVFITSNFDIDKWWSEKVIWERNALLRRITMIYEYSGTNHVDCIIKKLK